MHNIFRGLLTGLLIAGGIVLLLEWADDNGESKRTHTPGYAAAIALAKPSVVNIQTLALNPEGPELGAQPASLGSAVIVSEEGYLLTNHHVIASARKITAETASGEIFGARLIGSDPATDLAVLKLETSLSVPAIRTGDPSLLRSGDIVLAIGNSLGFGQTVTQGIISAVERDSGSPYVTTYIQTDAAINQGNSGGALITPDGALIGINSFIVTKSGGSDGLGFAIPVDLAMEIANELIAHGSIRRGWIGELYLDRLSDKHSAKRSLDAGNGLLVIRLQHFGPLQLAGVKPGDILLRINNQQVNFTMIQKLLAQSRPGDALEIQYWRDGQVSNISIHAIQNPN